MDLRLGCREKRKSGDIYYLRDGQALTRQEWISLVEQQVKKQGHEQKLEEIEKTVKFWNKDDTEHEVALQVYTSKYCANISHVEIPKKMSLKVVRDSMGYEQLSF